MTTITVLDKRVFVLVKCVCVTVFSHEYFQRFVEEEAFRVALRDQFMFSIDRRPDLFLCSKYYDDVALDSCRFSKCSNYLHEGGNVLLGVCLCVCLFVNSALPVRVY